MQAACHPETRHSGADSGDRHARSAGLAPSVEQRAERGTDQGERGDRTEGGEIEQHPTLGRMRRYREEERTGERDRDERRGDRLQAMDENEPAEGLGLVKERPDRCPRVRCDLRELGRKLHRAHRRVAPPQRIPGRGPIR